MMKFLVLDLEMNKPSGKIIQIGAVVADYADALLLIWDGESKGSANMRSEMLNRRKLVYEVTLRKL